MNGVDVSEDLSASLMDIAYSDNMSDADTIDITLEDKDLKWQNEWYPAKGTKLTCRIGYLNSEYLDCGTFEVDEITISNPDIVTIRAIAAGFIKGKLRTDKSHTHEFKTLAEIVKTIAANAGLTVKGNIGNIRIDRSVQNAKRDMRYLRRLANTYGYAFNIRGTELNFYKQTELEKSNPVISLDKTDLETYSIGDKSTKIYAAAEVRFHNPLTGKLIEHTEKDPSIESTDDVLVINEKCDNLDQARAIAAAALSKANKLQQSGNLSTVGNPYLVAGSVFELTGLGLFSGNYIIQSSNHTISISSGWTTDLDIYKVGFVSEDKLKPKTKKKKKESDTYTGSMASGDKDLFNYQ